MTNASTVTVCGEGLVDLVPTAAGGLSPLVPALGGGPFNAAIAASRLGAPVKFLSRLSTDGFGYELVSRLEAEGVDTALVQRGPEPTTLALTSIGADGSASYTFYIEGTADRMVQPPESIETDIACFGTVSLALDPGASRYGELLHRLSAAGTFIALDPNIRPFYANDAHKAFLESLYPSVDLLKLSDEEEEFLDSPTAPIDHPRRGPRLPARAAPLAEPRLDAHRLHRHPGRRGHHAVPPRRAQLVRPDARGPVLLRRRLQLPAVCHRHRARRQEHVGHRQRGRRRQARRSHRRISTLP